MRALMMAMVMLASTAVAAEFSPPIVTVNPVVLKDGAQGKDLALRVTVPLEGRRVPVILFSHGATYSKDDYLPLTEFWAAHGYAVIQPTHIDSLSLGLSRDDDRVKHPWKSRLLDMRKILDSLDEIERSAPALKDRFDRAKVVAAGHSFGGHTAVTLVNGRMPDESVDLTDKRVMAVISLSPPSSGGVGARNVVFPEKIRPQLLIVGQEDNLGSNTGWQAHADYYYKGSARQCLAAMSGMKHYLGGILGINRTEEQTPDTTSLEEVQRITLAFLDTQTKGSKAWDLLREQMTRARPPSVGVFTCK